MTASLRTLIHRMDEVHPPLSMRTLAGRFRYLGLAPGATPMPVISLLAMWGRAGDQAQSLQFLHYNTWLLRDAFRVADVVKVLGGGVSIVLGGPPTAGFAHFLSCLGITPAALLAQALKKFGTSDVCDKYFPPIVSVCGVSLNPLNDACRAVGDVAELAGFLIDKLGWGIDAIF